MTTQNYPVIVPSIQIISFESSSSTTSWRSRECANSKIYMIEFYNYLLYSFKSRGICVCVTCIFAKSEQKHKPLHDIAFHGWQIIYMFLCYTAQHQFKLTHSRVMHENKIYFCCVSYKWENLENASLSHTSTPTTPTSHPCNKTL